MELCHVFYESLESLFQKIKTTLPPESLVYLDNVEQTLYIGFKPHKDFKRFKEIIKAGGTGLSTAFDMPTLLGLDSDDPMSLGEVGRCGVAVDSLADMEDLYAGIDLSGITTSMTINSTAVILLCLYIAVGKKQGVSSDRLMGTVQNDILKEYVARGTYIYPVEPSLRLVTDIFEYCASEVPRWNSISISG